MSRLTSRLWVISGFLLSLILILGAATQPPSTAPEIIYLSFPKEIKADGKPVSGVIAFKDIDGDVIKASFIVVEAKDFQPFSIDPKVKGIKKGEFQFQLSTTTPQQVTLWAVLMDEAGHKSAPWEFSFTAVATAILQVSPTSLSFSSEVGRNPASQTIQIANAGTGTLSWSARADQAWISLSPTSGTAPSSVTVSINTTNLSVGSYSGQITVTAAGAQGSPATVRVTLTVTAPQIPPGMVLIPAGSFQMGDSFNEGDSDERPVHTVSVSAFYMDKYEVTKALWDEVASWASRNGYDIGPSDGEGKGSNHPVNNVTWYEAVKWANARSEKEGLVPCYYTDSSQRTVYRRWKVDIQNDWVKWEGCGYRLPTEAEWEYAARGGCEGHRFPWCDTDTIQHSRANYYSSGFSYDTSPTQGYHPSYATGGYPYTSPVGSFVANGYGLYDMAGNVWEWIWDWYDARYYSSSPNSDPRGPASGSGRVRRGGGWYNYAYNCRVVFRDYISPDSSLNGLGFRLVRTAP